jgi:TonB family protein
MRFFTLALVLLTGAPARADADSVPDAGRVLTQPPVLLEQVEATFPPDALDAGEGGAVTLEVDIAADGHVSDARVVKPAGGGFDEAALEAVRRFKFSPAEVDGKPDAVRILYTYEFVWRPQVVEAPVTPAPDLVNFSGTLVERGTRNPLANASVVVRASGGDVETSSDAAGHFELRNVAEGHWPVLVTAAEHVRYEVSETFKPSVRTEVTYYVRKQVYGAYETVVRAERERKDVSEVVLKQEEIRLVPGTQGDVFKVVEDLPGVARAPYNLGLLIVRGGTPWDTRVYVDDTLVPLLFHFAGLYATFNANLVQDLTFEPGNFGIEYGRATGGLVNAQTRTPSEQGVHGYADVNLIDASALAEAPLNDEWSVAIAGRRSYIDVTLPFVIGLFVPSVSQVLGFTTAPRYYDYQVKVDRHPKGSRDHLVIEFFGSNDRLGLVLNNPAYDPEGRANFDTVLAYNRFVVNWDHWLSPTLKFISHNNVGWDHNELAGGFDLFFNVNAYPVSSRDGFTWDLPGYGLTFDFGTDLYLEPFSYTAQGPPPFELNAIPDPFTSRTLIYDQESAYTFEPALYADVVWKVGRLKLVPGIRADFDSYMHKGWIDPRLNAFWQLFPKTTLKAGWGLYHEPPDYQLGELSPKFGNPNLLPQGAIHYAVGFEQKLTDAIHLDLTFYYKQEFHVAEPTLATLPSDDPSQVPPPYVSTGLGRSYGVELLLRHQLSRNFFGWVAYSLSRSEVTFPGIPGYVLNPFDQTHNLVALASYKLPGDWIVGARVRYTTGPLDTPDLNGVYDNNGNYYYPIFGAPFSRRLPPFFELDVRVDKRFVFNKWMLAAYADVQNVTNRNNPESVVYNFNYTQQSYLQGLPILPSIGVRGEL